MYCTTWSTAWHDFIGRFRKPWRQNRLAPRTAIKPSQLMYVAACPTLLRGYYLAVRSTHDCGETCSLGIEWL
jgi:hypothetical protein